ncbi:MAG: choloylglycine hydrolase family protein [Oscillospiraceae bacterium]
MCTSLTMQTKNNEHLLARTMDFAFELDATISYMPKEYNWASSLSIAQKFKTKYAFIGAGRNMGGQYYFVDGVNQHGLAMAELYFPGEAKYHADTQDQKINLAPQELVLWLLGGCRTIDEVTEKLSSVRLVDCPMVIVNITPPLHYIITDNTGRVVILESDSGELVLKENPAKVLTNSPELEWQLKNLNNFLHLSNSEFPTKNFSDYSAQSFGQGSGSFGLPGGYTPPERFVRAAFLRHTASAPSTIDEGVNALLHILHSVDIAKGAVVHQNGYLDYTQYISVMSLADKFIFT